MYSRPIVCVLSFFCCWYSVRMMARHQNLLYEEENERVQFSFNSQTLVPRLISRLGEREGNAMLNEKKRDGRKNPLPFIWYGNISCSHTLRGYENKRLGDGRDRGKRVRKGRGRKPGEMYRMICFSGKEEIEEEVRVGRWRRHRGRGDERGMKREREIRERRTYYISLFNSSPADETKSEMWWELSVQGAERKVPLICETFWGTEPQIDRRATTKTDG